jgi:hypothetical protein
MARRTLSKGRNNRIGTGRNSVQLGEQTILRGEGGETHQVAGGEVPVLTTQQGTPVADDQNSLKIGRRGPTALEDFHFREKIFHFDHERIPERVVHARGFGAHGYFENYGSLADIPAPICFRGPRKRRPSSCASRQSPVARDRRTWRATCAASPSSCTRRKATGTLQNRIACIGQAAELYTKPAAHSLRGERCFPAHGNC